MRRAHKSSPSMGAGTKAPARRPLPPLQNAPSMAPLTGADSPLSGEMSRRDKRGRDAGSRRLTEGCIKFCSDLSLSASPSYLPGRKAWDLRTQGFPYEWKAGMPPAVQKGADQICWPAPFFGLIFTHSIAIAVVFGSCFGALFGIESCRMPFSNFARISFGSRPSPT